MEKTFKKDGNSHFTNTHGENSLREERNSQEERQPRRSFNPNFDRDNRVYGSRDSRKPAYRSSADATSNDLNSRKRRPRIQKESTGSIFSSKTDFSDSPFSQEFNNENPVNTRNNSYNNTRESRSFEPRERSFAPRQNREDRSEKPSYNRSYNREERSDRPSYNRSFNREERSDRPSYNRSFNREERSERPSYNREERSDRPSFNRPYNREDNRGGSRGGGRPSPNGERFNSRSRNDNRGSRFNKRDKTPFSLEPVIEGDVRLNRFVAMSGICSRREADELIITGQITVNGEVVSSLGTKITANDVVTYKDKVLKGEKLVYIVMNKPKNCVTTVEDPNAEMTVIDLLKGKVKERVFPVGRLDKNSMGVIILTNDGELTKELTHPSYEKKKIYHLFLDREVDSEDIAKLAEGIELEDGHIYADELSYVEDNPREVGIEIHSGRNRIVRRMFEHIGYKVLKLDRVYFAGITKKGLKRGFWRYLTAQEVMRLKQKSNK